MGLIENYIADLENVEDLYTQNWVLPFGSAYTLAHEQFRNTLAAQTKYDEMKRDLFITAVTLGFGAGMGGMFGKTAFRTVVADQALAVVCNRNMERTFNLMHRVSTSVPGTFLVEGVWDAAAGLLGTAAKDGVTSLFNRPGASANAVQNPQIMQNDLQAYVLRCKTAAHGVAADLRDNPLATQSQKDSFATAMRGSEFFRNAPRRDLIGDRQTAANLMELSFYMVMTMDSDFVVEQTTGFQGAHEINRTRRLGGVSLPTTDRAYGVLPAMRSASGPGFATTTSTYVDYDNLGGRVLDRCNELYRARFREDFIPNAWYQSGNTTRAAVAKAERALDSINRTIHAMTPRRSAP